MDQAFSITEHILDCCGTPPAEQRLGGANLTGAILIGAHLDHADLDGATLARANLTDVRWAEGVPVPAGWTVDSDSGRLKPAGQLSEVMTRYLR